MTGGEASSGRREESWLMKGERAHERAPSSKREGTAEIGGEGMGFGVRHADCVGSAREEDRMRVRSLEPSVSRNVVFDEETYMGRELLGAELIGAAEARSADISWESRISYRRR